MEWRRLSRWRRLLRKLKYPLLAFIGIAVGTALGLAIDDSTIPALSDLLPAASFESSSGPIAFKARAGYGVFAFSSW
jgi:hypothetical protein